MLPVLKNNWQPTASIAALKKRAHLIQQIRTFFAARAVLEVETPLLSHATVTDLHVRSLTATFAPEGMAAQTVYLQTSPEYAMKRLLAAGSGSIYQICKAFRQDQPGVLHNPEFTLLEWYRLGFDHHALMDEMDALLQTILAVQPALRLSYAAAFTQHVGLDPHIATDAQLLDAVRQRVVLTVDALSRNDCLDILMTHCVEPQYVDAPAPLFLYDFPASQAALARIRPEQPPIASRFEVYFRGQELANGFHELANSVEQRQRFEKDLYLRAAHHPPVAAVPIDELFLAALAAGLPDCAGVALGVDRLIMLALGADQLENILSFGFARS